MIGGFQFQTAPDYLVITFSAYHIRKEIANYNSVISSDEYNGIISLVKSKMVDDIKYILAKRRVRISCVPRR